MTEQLHFSELWPHWPELLAGLWVTVQLTVLATIGGLAIGILGAAIRSGRPGMLSRVWGGYVEIIRNTPFVVLAGGTGLMTTFTDWDIIRNLLLAGRWTVLLSLVAFTGGALVTLPLLLLRLTGGRQVKRLIRGYIELFQGTPLLMQLFLAFFGVALFGVDVSAWTAASVALTLYTSAFLLDIWFGSIRALPKGQWEASRCLGLSFGQTLYRVVAPQALRIAIAPTVGFAVQVIKGTALASIIGFVELTKAGTMLTNVTYQPFKVFALVALGYFILCYPLSRYSRYLENKFNASHHH